MTSETSPPARWSEPEPAYPVDRIGMSPYLHYFKDLRDRRSPKEVGVASAIPEPGDQPFQFKEILDALIEDAFR